MYFLLLALWDVQITNHLVTVVEFCTYSFFFEWSLTKYITVILYSIYWYKAVSVYVFVQL